MPGRKGIKNIKNSGNIIAKLSPHLFWDVDSHLMDVNQNKKFIIQRVLAYGLMSDWQIIHSLYGIEDIANIAVGIKDLDKKSLAFVSLLSKIPEENFSCYTSMRSIPQHWNF